MTGFPDRSPGLARVLGAWLILTLLVPPPLVGASLGAPSPASADHGSTLRPETVSSDPRRPAGLEEQMRGTPGPTPMATGLEQRPGRSRPTPAGVGRAFGHSVAVLGMAFLIALGIAIPINALLDRVTAPPPAARPVPVVQAIRGDRAARVDVARIKALVTEQGIVSIAVYVDPLVLDLPEAARRERLYAIWTQLRRLAQAGAPNVFLHDDLADAQSYGLPLLQIVPTGAEAGAAWRTIELTDVGPGLPPEALLALIPQGMGLPPTTPRVRMAADEFRVGSGILLERFRGLVERFA